MSPVFLDTSGLIAVINTDDQWHPAAEAVWQQLVALFTSFLTTSLVLVEDGDGLSRIDQRSLALSVYDRLTNSPLVDVVHSTADLEVRAWELFRRRADKEWSVTDCVSFIVMNDRGITDAFTTDHHFEQAGLIRLIK